MTKYTTAQSGLYEGKDPLIGDNDGTGGLTIPCLPIRQRVGGEPRFVRVRGGGYFFLPSIAALRFLATEARRPAFIQDNSTQSILNG